jgi:hypothetical protein
VPQIGEQVHLVPFEQFDRSIAGAADVFEPNPNLVIDGQETVDTKQGLVAFFGATLDLASTTKVLERSEDGSFLIGDASEVVLPDWRGGRIFDVGRPGKYRFAVAHEIGISAGPSRGYLLWADVDLGISA